MKTESKPAADDWGASSAPAAAPTSADTEGW